MLSFRRLMTLDLFILTAPDTVMPAPSMNVPRTVVMILLSWKHFTNESAAFLKLCLVHGRRDRIPKHSCPVYEKTDTDNYQVTF